MDQPQTAALRYLYEQVGLAVAECPNLRGEKSDDQLVAAAALMDLTLAHRMRTAPALSENQWRRRAVVARVVRISWWLFIASMVGIFAWLAGLLAQSIAQSTFGLYGLIGDWYFIVLFVDIAVLTVAPIAASILNAVGITSLRLAIADSTPLGDPVLDDLLARFARQSARSAGDWRARVLGRGDLRDRVTSQLTAQGLAKMVQVRYGERIVRQAVVNAEHPAVVELSQRLHQLVAVRKADDAHLFALILLLRGRPQRLRSLLSAEDMRTLQRRKIVLTSHAGRQENALLALFAAGVSATEAQDEQRKDAIGSLASQLVGIRFNAIGAIQGEEPEIAPSVAEIQKAERSRSTRRGLVLVGLAVAAAALAAGVLAFSFAFLTGPMPAWESDLPLLVTPLLMLAGVILGVRALRNFGLVGARAITLGSLVVVDLLGIPMLFNLPFEVSATLGAVVIPGIVLAFIAYRRVGISWLAAAAIVAAGVVCSKTSFAVGWAILLGVCVVATFAAGRSLIVARRQAREDAQGALNALVQALAAARQRK